MCSLTLYGAFVLAILSTVSSLEILSPTPGSGIDPTKPVSILWSVDYNDPALIDIKFTNANPNGVTTDLTLATGVASYTGAYTVPENTIQNFGTGYQILIISGGNTIASSTGLVLGQSSNEVSTDANGQVTLVSTTSGQQQDSATLTSSVPTASVDSVGVTTISGTRSATDAAATTSRVSSFVTSTASRSSSGGGGGGGSSSPSATSAQSTNTANGQRRLGGELVLGAAGALAGLVALFA
ncbi:uncharacterized protein A1O9_05697 [Exophiala aquamarina CBS 119918]|uniref:Yeast cell wall synthesis Kre9/Knh1-like N-terminal domain-containing protein n=1 Tax=Exophiala aquamarina CBS 119918 TaxID=1182545 RepID=A0A072PDG8_9EURO|nr:uncharacterized protein A1O9_05697 [Exophiala aquamarina CBS 119918]KEF57777.1 hypothetical protein A1O9_05697 [Exophiala aquamarina CBS 119918]